MTTRFTTFVSLLLMLLQELLMPRMVLAQTDPAPSNVKIYHLDSSIVTLRTPIQLLGNIGDFLNVCADGARDVTFIIWTRPDLGPRGTYMVRLQMDTTARDNPGFWSLPDSIVGSFDYNLGPGNTHPGGIDTLWLEYTHPSVLPPTNSSFRTLYLNFIVSDYRGVGDSLAFAIPVHIYRPPVVMIHGLFANRETFTPMRNAMLSRGWSAKDLYEDGDGALLNRVDYSGTHAASFLTNQNVVPNAIIAALTKAVNEGYSAAEVDIVAHSMGGILAVASELDPRVYIGINEHIHKLITLNTPFAGTQSANLLSDQTKPVALVIRSVFSLFDYNTFGGAVSDLCVDSDPIKKLRGLTQLGFTNGIPKHAIITTAGIFYDNDWDGIFWIVTKEILQRATNNILFNNEYNDLIVPYSSQSGGLTGSNISVISPQAHAGSASDSYVIDEVISLLNLSPDDPAFTIAPFNPPVLTYNSALFKTQQNPPGTLGITQSQIAITTPLRGSVVSEGSTVNVTISGSSDIGSVLFLAGKQSSGIYIDSLKSSSGTLSYNIPNNVVGPLTLVATGFGGNALAAYDSLHLLVTTTAVLDSILAAPTVGYLTAGDSMSITVTGKYGDHVDRDVSDSPQLTLTSTNTSIATLSQSKLVRGINPGNTTVTVSYLGKKTTVTVNVLAGAVTSVGNGQTSKSRSTAIPNGFALRQNYPNPFNPSTTISYGLPTTSRVRLQIYNILGQVVADLVNSEQAAGWNQIVWNANVASGLYFCRLEAVSVNDRTKRFVDVKKMILLK